jgi:hypothetical protein
MPAKWAFSKSQAAQSRPTGVEVLEVKSKASFKNGTLQPWHLLFTTLADLVWGEQQRAIE